MADSILSMQAENALASGKAIPRVAPTVNYRQARRVAEEFEAFFLSQALQPMFANISAEEPFGGGPGEDLWRSMQVDEYGKAFARAGGIGIADAVLREILKMQEGS